MFRQAFEDLKSWRAKATRKPLILRGARQVGKTWLMREFGQNNYDNVAYFNLEMSPTVCQLFTGDLLPQRIIMGLQIESGLTIDAEKTLIIIDEIQTEPRALTALKYFTEQAPQYHIIAAGSLLGVALHAETSFPVGKVEFLDLYPLSFLEFLQAVGEEPLANLIESGDTDMINNFSQKLKEQLKLYYFVGGMPEVVKTYVETKDLIAVRTLQLAILTAYEQDFSKHAPSTIVPRIRLAWNSISSQLSKENRKFVYGIIREGARAKEYELALQWLIDCGLAHRVTQISKPHLPLKAYEEVGSFKIYLCDVGLLGAMSRLEAKTILEPNRIFTEFKGSLTEQFVLQECLATYGVPVHFWSSAGTAELDFIFSVGDNIIPVEVKAEENLQAKSLKVFHNKYNIEPCFRLSMSNFRDDGWLINVPLYAASIIHSSLKQSS